jgi:hypothetical protein
MIASTRSNACASTGEFNRVTGPSSRPIGQGQDHATSRRSTVKLIKASLGALLIAGAASVAGAGTAFASPPTFNCTNPKTGDTHSVPANEKSGEIKAGYYDCERQIPLH